MARHVGGQRDTTRAAADEAASFVHNNPYQDALRRDDNSLIFFFASPEHLRYSHRHAMNRGTASGEELEIRTTVDRPLPRHTTSYIIRTPSRF
jgi:hypothetical protein